MITLHSNVIEDEYTSYVKEAYDFEAKKANEVNIPSFRLPQCDWNIIAIIGSSGSGKSTILRSLGYDEASLPTFDERSVISNLAPLEPKEASELLCAMGLSSVPSWCRPISHLSNGEAYRARLAKMMSQDKDVILVDEFTSVVDRNAACAMAHSLAKWVKRRGKKVVLASCHYDILEYLEPDFIFDLNKGGALERGDRLRHPRISLRVTRVEPLAWRLFSRHHYMSNDLNEAASCFVASWEERPVAFCAILPLPSGTLTGAVRLSRTVVLPDFQGLGIGSALTDTLAGAYKSIDLVAYTKTVNPALGLHRDHSPLLWEPTMGNHRFRDDLVDYKDANGRTYLARTSYCHKYVGEPIYGYENILKPIAQMRRDKSLEGQLSLF